MIVQVFYFPYYLPTNFIDSDPVVPFHLIIPVTF